MSDIASNFASAPLKSWFIPAKPLPAMDPAQARQHAELTKQAEKWVASSFYGTLLKQMHDSPFKSKLFDGGRGGEAFSGMYDQQLADRMSHGSAQKLVKTLVRHIEKSTAAAKYAQQAKPVNPVNPGSGQSSDAQRRGQLPFQHHPRRRAAEVSRNVRTYVAPTG